MILLVEIFLLSLVVSLIVGGLAWFLSKESVLDREKSSPFECGFDPLKSARIPFSLRFFLLAVIFLIFDVEIVLLFPIISNLACASEVTVLVGGMIFIFIVLFGLFHEWREGSLGWIVN
uniref:NADH-ubiquinone oxidoreductase chain 3 n=1 Tax=Hanleyella oldroydi TaxID=515356 RepID=A0A6H1PGY8_9MOLL|nr:NADH dehydrogenase subunit 3 [Hanleyella oldroydi]QIZ12617.1 NADH dehydrogenase subunit 3 [Hanleyella oldroydi]